MSVLAHPDGPWASPLSSPAQAGDEELVRRVRSGDQRAFEALYERYRLPLHRYCHSIVRQREDAEEAFQATMLSAYGALTAGGEREIALRAWLYRIAHNACISTLRRRRGHEAAALRGLEAAPDDVAQRAELTEDLRQLQRDLGELPDAQRSALVMRELGGLSHLEIGRALGAEASVVKQLIYEARLALHDHAQGRELDCQAVRRTVSDGDGRALRGRSLRAHLRACAGCRDFQASLGARPARLAAIAPVLPAAAFGEILSAVTGTAAASAMAVTAGAGAGGVGAATLGAGGAAAAASLTGAGAGAGGGLALKLALIGSVALGGGGTAALPLVESAGREPAPAASLSALAAAQAVSVGEATGPAMALPRPAGPLPAGHAGTASAPLGAAARAAATAAAGVSAALARPVGAPPSAGAAEPIGALHAEPGARAGSAGPGAGLVAPATGPGSMPAPPAPSAPPARPGSLSAPTGSPRAGAPAAPTDLSAPSEPPGASAPPEAPGASAPAAPVLAPIPDRSGKAAPAPSDVAPVPAPIAPAAPELADVRPAGPGAPAGRP